jgi:hypothetical protein
VSRDETTLSAEVLDADRPSEPLRASIHDLCSAPPPELDWNRIEASLTDRIARENGSFSSRARRGNVVWLSAAMALAAAASFAFFVSRRAEPPEAPLAAIELPAPAGALIALRGAGDVRVGGQTVARGGALAQGARVEAAGATGVFERVGKVRWLLEPGSAVTIARADAPLIVALERGATEAQVVPVPSGEAFAVDVTSARGNVVRVAVHGTHLRVARSGDHVTVDLTEGVVSIGAPPRRGSTLGELVTAPAHVELDVDDVSGSLRIAHAAEAVRAAVSLDGDAPPAPQGTIAALAPVAIGTSPRVYVARGSAGDATAPAASASPPLSNPQTVAGMVRACQQGAPQSAGVTVTVSTTVTLRVGEDGYVQSALFNPPLAPSVQDCVAHVLYDTRKTRFESSIELSVPVDVTR